MIKDGSSAVHACRMEMRQPTVGAADPRVNMLACLDGLRQVVAGRVPKSTLDTLRRSRQSIIKLPGLDPIGQAINSVTIWDGPVAYLDTAAVLDESARDPRANGLLDEFVGLMTDDRYGSYLDEDGLVFRRIINSIRQNAGHVVIDGRNNPWADNLRDGLSGAEIKIARPRTRVKAEAIIDSPEAHMQRRGHLAGSRLARRILGPAAGSLTGAQESVDRRQELIDRQMVVTGN